MKQEQIIEKTYKLEHEIALTTPNISSLAVILHTRG